MKLNYHRLNCKPKKDYAEIILFGDVHYGSRFCDWDRAKSMLDYCLANSTYLFCLGDILESATRYSIGSGVYEQLNPQQQMEDIIEALRPLAEKGLIVGYLNGNHEDRITKETGIDVSKMICRILGIPYLGAAGWSLFRVGGQNYTTYSIHGSSGSKFNYTKLKAAIDTSHYFSADILTYSHVHNIITDSIERQFVDLRSKTIQYRKSYIIITGHYLKYHGSYAQAKGLPPSKLGSPKLKLFRDKFDIHVST